MRKRMLVLPALAVVLAFAFVAVDAAEGAIIKGPYLMYEGAETEMTVLWQLDNSTPCTIEWGSTQSYGTSDTTSEYGTDHQYAYTISGLAAGTKYYYNVVGVGSGSFTTAPPSTATDVKFLAFGDTRAPGDNQEPTNYNVVCGEMNASVALGYQTMALHVGDWIYSNTEKNWDWFFDSGLTNALNLHATVPIQGCKGNHEGISNSSVYEKYYDYPYVDVSGLYWSFDYGPVHIAIVDQYTSFGVGSTQYIWLENDLATSTKQWKIIVLHEPGWNARSQYNGTVRTAIQPLCEAYGVDIVFGGHAHFYSRCDVPYADDSGKFVHHITTGGGGAPLYGVDLGLEYVVAAESSLQFCEIDIQGDVLTLVSRRVSDGDVIDTFTVSHVDIYPPTASVLVPLDNGPDDLDADDGEVTVNTTQPLFDIQLSDVGDGIDDATVLSATVALTKDSAPLVEGTDYSVGYDAGLDVITLTPAVSPFGNGLYAITLSGIADLAGNPMAATTLSILIDTSIVPPVTLSFQQGVDGYIGMVDTMIRAATGNDNYADSATQYYGGYQYQYNADTDSSGGPCQILLRFDGIIGPSQIPAGSAIVSATLRIRSTDDGNGGKLHRMLQAWVDTDITWNNSFGGDGIQADGTEAVTLKDDGVPSNNPNTDVDLDVTATVQDLADGAAVNNGWAILPNGTNGWHIAASEYPTSDYRPELIVTFAAGGNQAPVVNITLPTEGATFSEGDSITIEANASDADGTVSLVEFYRDGIKLGEDSTASPYSYTWNNVPGGSYSLTAKATDDEGLASTSAPVSITVNAPNAAPTANAGPDQTVIDSDWDDEATVTLDGSGSSDSDGTIASYEWKEGQTVLGTDVSIAVALSVDESPHTVTLTVTDDQGATGSDDVVITVNAGGPIDDVANIDISVRGTVGGSFVDTQTSNGVYEALTERESGGKPKDRHSLLEHKWTIDVTGGATVTFFVEAFKNDGATEDFVFAYSMNDSSYTDMVTVSKTADDDTAQSYPLPASTSGTVYIRVLDTDRTKGSRALDTISIDHMYIRSEGQVVPDTEPPAAPTNPAATAVGDSRIDLNWDSNTEPDLSHYIVKRGTTSGEFTEIAADVTTTSYSDTGLTPSTTYFYVVTAVDTSGNESPNSSEASATTAAPNLQASDPTPSDGQTNVNRKTVVLSWLAGAGANSHDVYLGTSPILTDNDRKGNQTETTYKPSSLSRKTTYYWRIDEVASETVPGGVVWSFTTK